MAKSLTALALAQARPRARDYKLGAGHGLFVLVKASGAKYWRWKFRWGGKEKLLSLGVYPAISLADARRERDRLRAVLARGQDPAALRAQRKAARTLSASNTLAAMAKEWLDVETPTWAKSHADKVRCRINRHLLPRLGKRPVRDIGVQEMLACLRAVEATGALDTARRVRSHAACIFRYAVTSGRCERNPAADLVGVLKVPLSRPFPTITDPARVGELLRAIEAYRGWFTTKALLRLSPLLFQRPGEMRAMAWSELDLDAALWTVPSMRMKRRKAQKINGEPHLVPLPRQAVAILQDLRLMSGGHHYVFPSLEKPHAPLSANTLSKALEKMGFKRELVPHGFRHMADTLLHELGWSDEAIERQLSHVDPNEVRRIYNQAKYLDERRRMMQAWADYLVQLRDGATVLPLTSRSL